jgi:plastocyanin
MPMRTILLAAVCAALASAGAAQAAKAPTFNGVVGPGFTITMAKKPARAGTITLAVADKSSIHNFRLKGPGVNVATSVGGTGSKRFTVTLKKGKYTFLCDPHATSMVGSFTVK